MADSWGGRFTYRSAALPEATHAPRTLGRVFASPPAVLSRPDAVTLASPSRSTPPSQSMARTPRALSPGAAACLAQADRDARAQFNRSGAAAAMRGTDPAARVEREVMAAARECAEREAVAAVTASGEAADAADARAAEATAAANATAVLIAARARDAMKRYIQREVCVAFIFQCRSEAMRVRRGIVEEWYCVQCNVGFDAFCEAAYDPLPEEWKHHAELGVQGMLEDMLNWTELERTRSGDAKAHYRCPACNIGVERASKREMRRAAGAGEAADGHRTAHGPKNLRAASLADRREGAGAQSAPSAWSRWAKTHNIIRSR